MNYRILIILGLLCILPLISFGQNPFPVQVEGENITVSIPGGMIPATAEDIRQKYVSSHPPLILYTSEDRQSDFGVNTTPTPWGPSDVPLLKEVFKSNIYSLYDEVKMIQDTVMNRKGRDYVVLEFVGTLNPEENTIARQSPMKKYQYLMYTVRDHQVLLFFFIGPEEQIQMWQGPVEEAMAEVKIKSKKE